MARTTFATPYTFYRLTETRRKAMIGTWFRCRERGNTVYFPVGLSNCFNYGVDQGLIFVTAIQPQIGVKAADGTWAKNRNWFRVGVCSPDDLDLDLDFEHHECHLRQDVISFLEKTKKTGVSYCEVLEAVRAHVKGGTIR